MTNKDASIIIGNIPIEGDDCYTIAEYQEAKAMAIKALEQQLCEDCISREAVIDVINFEDKWLFEAKSHNADTHIAFSGLESRVKALPSVTPQRPKGKWIEEWLNSFDTLSATKCFEAVNILKERLEDDQRDQRK